MPSGAKTAIKSVPSPTDTALSHWTAPLPRQANHVNARIPRQINRQISQQHGKIDPRLQGLNPYLASPMQRPRSVVQQAPEPSASPIARWRHQSDQPWTPLGLGMRETHINSEQANFHQQDNYGPYRQGPCSDNGSNVARSDSGYHTQSILSIDPGRTDQELSQDIMSSARNLNVDCLPTESRAMARRPSSHGSVSQYSSRSHKQQQFPCDDPDCDVVLKCQSEHKYVHSYCRVNVTIY